MPNITIPPEALEAAACAAYDKAKEITPDARDDWDDPARDAEKQELFDIVRAACLAMLRAWPGMATEFRRDSFMGWDGQLIILPLPQEARHE